MMRRALSRTPSAAALAALISLAAADPAAAQQHEHAASTATAQMASTQAAAESDTTAQSSMSGMDHSTMDHSTMDHAAMDHATTEPMPGSSGDATPRTPIPTPTQADREAAFPTLQHMANHAPPLIGYLLVDRLEAWDTDHGNGQAWEVSGWYGGDIDRVWLRSEGERNEGRTDAADLELAWGHAISPWWDLLLGVRQDSQPGSAQTRAAIGLQGLAPYKFEFATTLYLGGQSNAQLRVEADYDVLLTNRLVLQPRIEANAALDDDPARGIGGGLDDVEAGLRLRYEISRRFAPYIGWIHSRRFGGSADLARASGEDTDDSRFVAGFRVWF